MVLSVEAVRDIACRYGYNEVQFNEKSRVISFKKITLDQQTVRINVYYTTGTVATCLHHPKSGKTQLFRRNQTEYDVDALFGNPRLHTGAGYYTRSGQGQERTIEKLNTWEIQKRERKGQGGTRDTECDDARRWRYVQAATRFCTDTQVGQIAAIARLWHSLRFKPGGLTFKESWDNLSEEDKQRITDTSGFRAPCCDTIDFPCQCCERAGAWCTLMGVATKIATEKVPIVAYHIEDTETSSSMFAPLHQITDCSCQDGLDFRRRYSKLLGKLDRQLRSLPKDVFNEVFVWYVDKMSKGRSNFLVYTGNAVDFESLQPSELQHSDLQFFGNALCSNEILACHRDYGDMVYDDKILKKGCTCHGL